MEKTIAIQFIFKAAEEVRPTERCRILLTPGTLEYTEWDDSIQRYGPKTNLA